MIHRGQLDLDIVYLAPGHSFEAHKAVVGHEIIIRTELGMIFPDKFTYEAFLSKEVLDAVRADPSVQFLERDLKLVPM